MITRSDTPPLSSENVAARRRLIAVIAVVVAFAGGYYLFARHAVAVRDAKRQPIQAEIRHIEVAQGEAARILDQIASAEDAYNSANKVADNVSKTRHDLAVENNASPEMMLPLEQKESAAVDTMIKRNDDEAAAYDKYANTIESVLGEGPVQKLRSDTQAYVTAYSVALSAWRRGVSSLIDDDKMSLNDGAYHSDDSITHDYESSDEGLTRGEVIATQVEADTRHLESQVTARLHDAKMRLAAIK